MIKTISLLGILTLMTTSCATGPLDTAGKVIATSQKTVDAAMQGWATYVVLQKPPLAQEDRVRGVLTRYQQTMLVAKTAYNTAFNQPTNQPALDSAIAVLGSTQVELLSLITSFSGETKKLTP